MLSLAFDGRFRYICRHSGDTNFVKWQTCLKSVCVTVSLTQPFFFCLSLSFTFSVLLFLSELPQYKKLDILFFLEVIPMIFHELSNQDKAVFWQESPVCQPGEVGLTFVQRCSSITSFSTAEFIIYQCTTSLDQTVG